MKYISKILIANRGEIACRIIRTAKKLGIKTVAVYSEVDKNAANVLMSDEGYCIGPAPSLSSYLQQNKIIEVAKNAKCEAIHPGYGFLSENAEFAELCENSELIFIGPSSSAIRDMGSKSISKEIMSKAGVPIISGYHGTEQANDLLSMEADRIGFPIMIKAVRGGGGKGMRIVTKKSDFIPQLESARRESLSACGDDSVLLERFIASPRHVEVQIFFDHFENGVYLFERDCSIQRRHQKIMEEAPAPGIDPNIRSSLGETAVRAGEAVKYVGAGTVEFIYDQTDKKFYFMEMNTRLQVEHAVTEMITNIDLVEWQIMVANGEKLPCKQSDIKFNGHAVEARIYAEDPDNGFLPTDGRITYLSMPDSTNTVRIETGVYEGDEVSVHYDPMIAKLIVWDDNRLKAFKKLETQLLKYNLIGPSTNIRFLINLCHHPELLAGEVHTNFIEDHKENLLYKEPATKKLLFQAALAKIMWENQEAARLSAEMNDSDSPWVLETGFRVNHFYTRILKLFYNNEEHEVHVTYFGENSYVLNLLEHSDYLLMARTSCIVDKPHTTRLIIHSEDQLWKCDFFVETNHKLHLFNENGMHSFETFEEEFDTTIANTNEQDSAVSPMSGVINKIFVKIGDKVKVGDDLMVVLAMKMEHAVKAPKSGIIRRIFFKVGENVSRNTPLIEVED